MASPSLTRSPPPIWRSPPPPEGPKESTVARLFIAPLTFISFIISLALIDTKNNNLRTHSHSVPHPPPTTLFSKIKAWLHHLCFKPTSPYAYVRSPDLKATEVKDEKEEKWYWHTKQKKMMKAEVADAFKIRKWVVVMLAMALFGGLLGFTVLVRWVLGIWEGTPLDVHGVHDSYAGGAPGMGGSLTKDW